MAHYTLSMTPIKRSDGRSATAAAAYRASAEIVDERTGLMHDYTRKRGVKHVELMAPAGITLDSLEALWNAAEAAETNKRGRAAREVLIALPCELDAYQRLSLAREMTADLVERYGVAAQLAVHAPDRDGDQRNHHAHILLTTRRYHHDGLGAKSQLEMSNTQLKKAGLPKAQDELKALRARYGAMQNAALERASITARVDHRSLADRGIDRAPQVHVGNYGTQMLRQGTPEQSERATLNREISEANREVQYLRDQLDAERVADAWAEQYLSKRRDAQHAVDEWAEITPAVPLSLDPDMPESEPSRASLDELSMARESVRMDAQERIEQNIADRCHLQIRAERRALERVQADIDARHRAENAAEAEREWEAWISQPGVCSATGRIIDELYWGYQMEREWEEQQRRYQAPNPAPPESAPKEPPHAPKPAPPKPVPEEQPQATAERSPEEAAAAAVRRVLGMASQVERVAAIREAMRHPDHRYADVFMDQMVEWGIGTHGDLSPEAQRAHEAMQDQDERKSQEASPEARHRRPKGPSGPGL